MTDACVNIDTFDYPDFVICPNCRTSTKRRYRFYEKRVWGCPVCSPSHHKMIEESQPETNEEKNHRITCEMLQGNITNEGEEAMQPYECLAWEMRLSDDPTKPNDQELFKVGHWGPKIIFANDKDRAQEKFLRLLPEKFDLDEVRLVCRPFQS